MKLIKTLAVSLVVSGSVMAHAMNVDEIISTYHENIGGVEKLNNIKGIRFTGSFQQGQMKFPMEVVQLASGKQYSKFSVQGKEIKQGVFDGETLWSTNFMTMKPEKAEADMTYNIKLEANDFPDVFLDYKKKGYTIELMGTETVDGAEAYKLKVEREPIKVEGKEVPNVSYYYFDSEAMIPLMVETEIKQGQGKGLIQQVKMSDYQEVEGIYFPFTISQGVKGQGEAPMSIEKIELNPAVSDAEFAYPEQK